MAQSQADALGLLLQHLGSGDPEAMSAAAASTAMEPNVLRLLSGKLGAENDPLDYSSRYNTALPPDQEQQYQRWLQSQSALNNRDMSRDTYDYDMRGAFLGGAGADPSQRGHYPDTYKKPNHPTFSTGSQYHGLDGQLGGVWAPQPSGGFTFTPGPTNLQMHGAQRLQDYFHRVEPDSPLILPQRDDSLIQILRKYGLLPPVAAGGLLGAGSEPPT